MNVSLFWSSLLGSVAGWIMYGTDKWINSSATDMTTIGILVGIIGIFGIVLSLTER